MYENKTIEEVCRQFECNGRTGLTQEEAGTRLEHYGKNMLREAKKKTLAQRFAEQLCDSLIFVLFAAAGISIMLHEYSDAVIILAVVAMNAVVGVIQEGKAEKALESLRKMTKLEAVVIRGGREMTVPAEELVPGDLVVLDAGRSSSCSGGKPENRGIRPDGGIGTCFKEQYLCCRIGGSGRGQEEYGVHDFLRNERQGLRNRNGYRHGYGNRQDCRADS